MSKLLGILAIGLAIQFSPDASTATYRKHGDVLLPDPIETPGAVRTTDVKQICEGGSTKQFRNTKESTKQHVCMMYGLKPHCYGRDTNEIDHEIALEIGGADEIQNLWPQPYNQHPGAHEKDALENHLKKMICNGEITPDEAQRRIVKDWYQLYLDLKLAPASNRGDESETSPGIWRAE